MHLQNQTNCDMRLQHTDTAVNPAALVFRAAAFRRAGNNRIMSPDEGAGSVLCPGSRTAADRHQKYAEATPVNMLVTAAA